MELKYDKEDCPLRVKQFYIVMIILWPPPRFSWDSLKGSDTYLGKKCLTTTYDEVVVEFPVYPNTPL